MPSLSLLPPPPMVEVELRTNRYDTQVGVSDTDSANPKISIEGKYIPLQFVYALSNLEFDKDMYYNVKVGFSNGTVKIIDQGSVPSFGDVSRNVVIHDIEKFIQGQFNIFQHLINDTYITFIKIYAWYPSTPYFGGFCRLLMVGVKLYA